MAMMNKTFMGVRVARLREERGISQVSLAKALGISPSYLNQIERNHRPLTVPILLRISAQLGVDMQLFSDSDAVQLIADAKGVLSDVGANVSVAEVRSLVANMPAVADALIDLHRAHRVSLERADALAAMVGDERKLAVPAAHEEVRDYLNRRKNHIAELDDAAETIFRDASLQIGAIAPRLAQRLHQLHNVRLAIVSAEARDDWNERGKSVFDARERTLYLPDHLRPGQQAFQLAAQLAGLELTDSIDKLVREGGFASAASARLARVAFANYFAGALVMPYGSFLQAAEDCSYDIERLANHFGVGFEAICHRLSTLQRPSAPGLPFFFMRADRAGNVSKRQSAADFHFSRVGGTCPLWIVYEAFSQPQRILTQMARMPDGRCYFWVARQVISGPPGFGSAQQTFAIGLGCDLQHARRLIYSRGLDLNPDMGIPIGPGCRVCERARCSQRAFPAASLPQAST
jgi:predicted transcriptional regulator/DNA-binding XRE family transcriptional regulator